MNACIRNNEQPVGMMVGIALLMVVPVLGGCGDDVGSVQFFVEAEESIAGGIEGGLGDENIADGWNVTYDKFLVTIGNVRASRTDTGETLGNGDVYVLDLRQSPASGYVIGDMKDVAAGTWQRFGFDMPNASLGVRTLAPTSTADVETLVQHGYSLYIEGALAKADGQSCPPGDPDPMKCVNAPKVTFRWGFAAGTSFDDCVSVDGLAGFAVPTGGTAQVKPTIHGDHWFFDNITAGVEIVTRYAQFVADCDLDHDGETTLDELKQVPAAKVFPSPKYNLSGALGGPVMTAYDYVLAQARTIGDYQGDGECPTRKVLP